MDAPEAGRRYSRDAALEQQLCKDSGTVTEDGAGSKTLKWNGGTDGEKEGREDQHLMGATSSAASHLPPEKHKTVQSHHSRCCVDSPLVPG